MGQESRDDAHLFILQALSSKPKWQWQSGTGHWVTGSEAGGQTGGGQGRRRGKQPPQGGSRAIKVAGQRGVIGPTQNQNIRSRVGQATTRQRDWQAHAKFRHETRQNTSQRSHFPFQPNPCVQFFPGLSHLCPGLSGCLDPGLVSSCISSLHCQDCMQYAPCSRSADDYLAHKHKLRSYVCLLIAALVSPATTTGRSVSHSPLTTHSTTVAELFQYEDLNNSHCDLLVCSSQCRACRLSPNHPSILAGVILSRTYFQGCQ